MCQNLAKNGYKVEYRETVEGSFDILLDGSPADLKKTRSHNHILDYALKAVKKQGAEIVIFEFEANELTPGMHDELNKLKRMGIEVKYFLKDGKVKTL
jgi:hypothetical protein